MIATMLALLSKFLVFLGKWMTMMMKTWHHTFASMKSTWQQVGNEIFSLVQYGMHNMLVSLQ